MNLWTDLLGFLPFVLLFAGLAFTRIPAFAVTFLVLVASVFLSAVFWHTGAETLLHAAAEGTLTALVPIIWVIFAAVLSYFISVETGAMETIKAFLLTLTPDRRIQAVLIAFCFGGFLEAVAGFGTAVAIPTAMLIAIGFGPVQAAILALIANSVPVAFGALGIPVIALAQITSLDVGTLTRNVALQLLPFSLAVPPALVVVANGGVRGCGAALREALLIGVAFTVTQTLIAFFVGPELVAVGASIVSLLVYVATRKRAEPTRIRPLAIALANFIILLVLVLVTRLIGVPKEPPFAFAVPIGSHAITIDWLTTPGTLLLISALAGGLVQGLRWNHLARLAWHTARKIRFSALTIIFILILAKTMTASGMITSVATTLAAVSGPLFPLVSPMLGALGTFITGSDTSSNILFGELQKQTAGRLGFSPEWLAAANTSGATAGKMISPQSIAVATSTVGIESRQGEILRRNIAPCVLYTVVLGLYVLAVAQF